MFEFLKKPTLENYINREVLETQIQLLDFQDKLEYYQAMVMSAQNRLNRLRSYNEKDPSTGGHINATPPGEQDASKLPHQVFG